MIVSFSACVRGASIESASTTSDARIQCRLDGHIGALRGSREQHDDVTQHSCVSIVETTQANRASVHEGLRQC